MKCTISNLIAILFILNAQLLNVSISKSIFDDDQFYTYFEEESNDGNTLPTFVNDSEDIYNTRRSNQNDTIGRRNVDNNEEKFSKYQSRMTIGYQPPSNNKLWINNGFLPPSYNKLNNRGLSYTRNYCQCRKLIVSSLGRSQHVQPNSMGIYNYYSTYNGHPSYFGPGSNRLYFLSNSGWLIGPSIGSPTGFIHNADQALCPYTIPTGWMYVDNGYWYNDVLLVVRCIG